MFKMGKMKKLLEVIRKVVRNPSVLNKLVDDPDGMESRVRGIHGRSQGLPTVDLLDLFPKCDTVVDPYSFLEGTSLVSDIALLNLLAASLKNCEYLEIGSWRGESLANVSKYAKHCTSISLSHEELRGIGASDEFIKAHNVFVPKNDNVTYIGHNSQTFDFESLGKKFDLIFVDGDHRYQGVKIDTANVFKLLKDDNSVIVWHDYGFSPETVRWSVLAGILDGTPDGCRKYLYHISNTLCAVYTKRELPGVFVKFPTRPNKSFSLKISADRL